MAIQINFLEKPVMKLVLTATGSSGDMYNVHVSDESGKPSIFCTCDASVNGLMCRHRKAIFSNKPGDIYSDLDAFSVAAKFAENHGFSDAYAKMEAELARLKKEYKKTENEMKKIFSDLVAGK